MEKVYLIASIEEYGKLMSFCINHDIPVWRCYWDERDKGVRCYHIDAKKKICFYSRRQFYEDNGFVVVSPVFVLDEFGNYNIVEVE